MALILAVLIALPLGILQAVKRNSLGDNVVTIAAPWVISSRTSH
jgi:ABC-type dipeptide/oligopeptide/nickel transport system permease component